MDDPALQTTILPTGTLSLQELPRDADAVYLFDFDGVIASAVEDAIYKLPEQVGESALLKKLADEMSIRIRDMEHRYQRHLIFQELAFRSGVMIERGSAFEIAKWAALNAKTFILTARSGWSATSRVREFISENLYPPIELYQVGRTKKNLQVSLLCSEFSDRIVYYIEDSSAHLEEAAKLGCGNLKLVHCCEKIDEESVLRLYRAAFGGPKDEPKSQ